ncbi:hypothetical protein GW17_00051321 [Ensete ventricosum]|nr:hypothetical protein GW17_00051321 [Ensete ventricosum]RZR92337.1 hypothetical protein BHM03_00020609 [Ensete ventricosum]
MSSNWIGFGRNHLRPIYTSTDGGSPCPSLFDLFPIRSPLTAGLLAGGTCHVELFVSQKLQSQSEKSSEVTLPQSETLNGSLLPYPSKPFIITTIPYCLNRSLFLPSHSTLRLPDTVPIVFVTSSPARDQSSYLRCSSFHIPHGCVTNL